MGRVVLCFPEASPLLLQQITLPSRGCSGSSATSAMTRVIEDDLVDSDFEDTDEQDVEGTADREEDGENESAAQGNNRGLLLATLSKLQSVVLLIAAILFVGGHRPPENSDDEQAEGGAAQPVAVTRAVRSLRDWAPRGKRRYIRHRLSESATSALRDLARGPREGVSPANQALLAEARAAAAAFVAALELFLEIEDSALANELLQHCSLDWSLRVSSGTPPTAPVPDAMAHDELLRVIFFSEGIETAHAQRVRARTGSRSGATLPARAPSAVIVPGPAAEAATAGRVLAGDASLVAVTRATESGGQGGGSDDVVGVAVLTATSADGTPVTPLSCLPFFLTADETNRYGQRDDL